MPAMILYLLAIFITGCNLTDDANNRLEHYELKKHKEFFLPYELNEISGLAFSEGKLYAHNDEKGIVYILNPEDGKIIKKFQIGARPVKKDFEGIAVADKYIFMVTSSGDLYKFSEPDSGNASYEIIKTPLNKSYDIEGLCYDDETNTLLLACKEDPKKDNRNARAVFTFDLSSNKLINRPRFIISPDEIKEKSGITNFSPSGIEKHADGNFYILSSNQKAIAVLSPDGKLIEAAKLPGKHMQPEGITFLPNNDMIISDEGGKDDAELTIYRYIRSE
jgi:uncharacterized protein YjiK